MCGKFLPGIQKNFFRNPRVYGPDRRKDACISYLVKIQIILEKWNLDFILQKSQIKIKKWSKTYEMVVCHLISSIIYYNRNSWYVLQWNIPKRMRFLLTVVNVNYFIKKRNPKICNSFFKSISLICIIQNTQKSVQFITIQKGETISTNRSTLTKSNSKNGESPS